MMVTLYFCQIAELDENLQGDARELVCDLKNFRDAPKSPREPLTESFIPVDMCHLYLVIEGPEGQPLYQSANLMGARLPVMPGESRTAEVLGHTTRVGSWYVDPYFVRPEHRQGTAAGARRRTAVEPVRAGLDRL